MRPSTRLTPRGLAFVAAGLVLAVAAGRLGQPNLVWPAVFAVVLPLVSLAATAATRPGFRVGRTLRPGVLPVGDDLEVDVSIVATRPSVSGLVHAEDLPPRAVGRGHRFALPLQRTGQLTRESYHCRPRRRGRFVLDELWFEFADLLGLATRTARVSHPDTVLVTPRILPMGPTPPQAFGRSGETPIPQTSLAGPDDTLVREYQPRDDVRRIHWKSTARRDTLMVRREEQAWDPTAWLVLDSRAGVHGGRAEVNPSFEWLVTVAASLGVHLIGEGYAVSLVDAEGRTFTGRHADVPTRVQGWVEHLVDAALTTEPSLATAARTVAQSPSGHLVVALLGALDVDDAHHLVTTHDAQQQCRALVVGAADPRAVELLVAHGWRVSPLPVDADLAATWAAP